MDIRVGGIDHADVQALLAEHVAFGRAYTPPENTHVLEPGRLADPAITLWTAWEADTLLGMGALRGIDAAHGEIKSMRTATVALRRGVARAMLDHLVGEARRRGYRRLSLETGTAPPFHPANRLYEAAGFVDCPAFGGYPPSPHNRFMTLVL